MTKNSLNDKEKEFSSGLDRERQNYIEKYREESRKSTMLQNQLDQKDLKYRELQDENQELKQRLKSFEMQQNQQGLSNSKFGTHNEQKYKSMLVYDYHLLTSILNNLDDTIKELD